MHPALVMALAETEGYRVLNKQNRIRTARYYHAPDFSPAGHRSPAFLAAWARRIWFAWPWGLDLIHKPRLASLVPDPQSADYPTTVERYTRWILARLTHVDWTGDVQAPLPAGVDPSMSLIDPDYLPYGDILHFVDARLTARWVTTVSDAQGNVTNVDAILQNRLSRRLEAVGLILQAAVFQWVHRQVSEGLGYLGMYDPEDEKYDPVDDFVRMPPPEPGDNALSTARQTYIAYWALVYLAFNASPVIWNYWVAIAAKQKDADEQVANYLLYRLRHGIGDPNRIADREAREAASNRLRVLGNMTRFAVALDAYLRLDFAWFEVDTRNPNDRHWKDGSYTTP
jgi:hypothetical protein